MEENVKRHLEVSDVQIKNRKAIISFTEIFTKPDNEGDSEKVTKNHYPNIKFGFEIHPDFRKKMDAFAIHYAMMIDDVDRDTVDPKALTSEEDGPTNPNCHPSLENIDVIKVSLGGNEKKGMGLVITGQRKWISGKVSTINAPFTRFTENDEFGEFLELAWGELVDEAIQYMKGKHAPDPQLTMFEEVDGEEEEPEESEEESEDQPQMAAAQ